MEDKNKLLIPGQKISLAILGDNDFHQYASKVENICEDGTIDVLIPMYKGQLLYTRSDALLKIIISKESAIYEFKVKIVNKIFGIIPLLKLERISEINKIQRRNYYRLKVIKKIKIRKAINFKEMVFENYFDVSLVDISGGGIGFTSSKELNKEDIVEINMELNSNIINMIARIIRKEYLDNNQNSMFLYGVHFEKITEIERNRIMRFIFEEQRKLAKKGMI